PEAKRFSLRPRVEEGSEVLEARTRRVSLASAGFLAARAPAFPREADMVAGLFEQVGEDGKLGRQSRQKIGALLEPPMPLAGEDSGARWRAGRSRHIRVGEHRTAASQLVEGGRLH